jgi:hypothetical protein
VLFSFLLAKILYTPHVGSYFGEDEPHPPHPIVGIPVFVRPVACWTPNEENRPQVGNVVCFNLPYSDTCMQRAREAKMHAEFGAASNMYLVFTLITAVQYCMWRLRDDHHHLVHLNIHAASPR